MCSTGSVIFLTISASSGLAASGIAVSGASGASAQEAGTLISTSASAPASMAAWFMATMSSPFFL